MILKFNNFPSEFFIKKETDIMHMMKTHGRKIFTDPVIIFMALFNIIFHLLFINNFEFHRDELLYFSLGLHPAAGYATVPPLIGWAAWLMETLFGYSLFAVHLLPALTSGR